MNIIEFHSLANWAARLAIPSAPLVGCYILRRWYGNTWTSMQASLVGFTERRWLVVAVMTVLPIAFRSALLPWVPIPEPRIHDEYVHLLVADTLSSGRLSNPTHPFWTHFEAPYVLHQPTYAAIYPPGQGAVLALGQWLTGEPWFAVVLSAGIMCGAICWAIQQLVGPQWGAVAGLVAVIQLTMMWVAGDLFAYWINSYWGGTVTAIGGVLVFTGLVRLMRAPMPRNAVMMSSGWSIVFFVRPFEAAILGLMLGAVTLVWLWRAITVPLRTKLLNVLLPIALVLSATIAFAAYYDYRITGNPWLHPYQLSRTVYGVPQAFYWDNPVPKPVIRHKSLEALYDYQLQELTRPWTLASFAETFHDGWSFFFGPFFTVPLLALPWAKIDRESRLLIGIAALGVAGHALYFYYLPHYTAAYTVVLVLLITLAMRAMARWRHRGRAVGGYALIAVFACALTPNVAGVGRLLLEGGVTKTKNRPYVEAQLKKIGGKHLVFVHYGPNHEVHWEWVFNAANIDSAPVVWGSRMVPRPR